MLLLREVMAEYHRFLLWYRDPRIMNRPLMSTPLTVISICIVYWLLVKRIIPKFMENRKAYDLRTPMLIYNAFQVLANLYLICLVTGVFLFHPLYADWTCIRSDRNSKDMTDIDAAYLYALLKIVDFADTIFMVLRKRNRQVTFLHVYHHILMAITCNVYLSSQSAGNGFFTGYMNCIVHVIMYAYYFLSAFSNKLKQSLWWKKHLTQIQLLQFVMVLIHSMSGIFHKSCDQSRTVLYFLAAQALIFIILFSNFYYKAYINPKTPTKKAE